jgi:peptidoglycan hydrolase FlgJ
MNTLPPPPIVAAAAQTQYQPGPTLPAGDPPEKLREAFTDFVGQTFYGQLLSAMRKTVGKPAYFHGGRGEEVFQGQMDQLLGEKLADSSADQFSGPMFELFQLSRR